MAHGRTACPDRSIFQAGGERQYGQATRRGTAIGVTSEPAAPKARSTETGRDIWRPTHNSPDQSGTVVLDHQDHWTLVNAKVMWCDPPARRALRHFVGLIERRLEAIALRRAEVELDHRADGRYDDLRREWKRGDNRPWGNCAVIGTVWRPPGIIVVELALNPVHHP